MSNLNPDFGQSWLQWFRTNLPESSPIGPEDITDSLPFEEVMTRYRQIERDIQERLFEIPEYVGQQSIWGRHAEKFDPFKLDLNFLPPGERAPFLEEIKKLFAGNDLMDFRAAGEGLPERAAKFPQLFNDRDGRSPSGRYEVKSVFREDGTVDPYMLFHSQITMGHDPTKGGAQAWDLTKSLPSSAMLENIQKQLLHDRAGREESKYLVFDIETPGLLLRQAPWQLSARLVSNKGESLADPLDLRFASRDMSALGVIWNERTKRVESLQGYLNQGITPEELPEGLMKFFDVANRPDVILAGHNIQFDVQRIVHNAKLHPAYATNDAFKTAVDTFVDKVYKDGRVNEEFRDTLSIARALYSDITPSGLLNEEERGRKFAMKNLLLQTDLFERAQRETEAQVAAAIQRGVPAEQLPMTAREFLLPPPGTMRQLHQADVDTFFEHFLHRAEQEQAVGGPGLQYRPLQDQNVMKAILGAAPYGPSIPLNKWSELDPDMRDRIARAGMVDKSTLTPTVTPFEYQISLQRHVGLVDENPMFADRSLLEMAEGGPKNYYRRMKRRFWDLPTPEEQSSQMGYQAGLWKKLSRDWVTEGRLSEHPVFPDWTEAQREMYKAGYPFAGLSPMERHIAATLGQHWETAGETERQARDIFGAMTTYGKFVGHQGFGVIPSSAKVVKMPEEVISRIIEEGAVQDSPLFSSAMQRGFWALDPFEAGKKHIGFKFNFSQKPEDAQREQAFILEHLRSNLTKGENYAERYNLSTKQIEDIEDAFATSTHAYGIQVGLLNSLTGSGNDSAVVHQVLEDVMGRTVMNTGQTPLVYVAKAGHNRFAGAFVRPELLEEDELAAIKEQTKYSVRLAEESFQQGDMPYWREFRRLAETGGGEGPLWEAYRKASKRAPIIGSAALMAGAGYYIHRRHKRRDYYEQSLFTQQLEPGPPPAQAQTQLYNSTYDGSSGRRSVNATGDLMQHLDRGKTQHMYMGSNKNNYLYGNA